MGGHHPLHSVFNIMLKFKANINVDKNVKCEQAFKHDHDHLTDRIPTTNNTFFTH